MNYYGNVNIVNIEKYYSELNVYLLHCLIYKRYSSNRLQQANQHLQYLPLAIRNILLGRRLPWFVCLLIDDKHIINCNAFKLKKNLMHLCKKYHIKHVQK